MNNLGTIKKMAETIGGDFQQKAGRLTMTFNREVSSDASIKLFISELFSTGVLGDEPPILAPDCVEYASSGIDIPLSENAKMTAGQSPETVVIEIDFMRSV